MTDEPSELVEAVSDGTLWIGFKRPQACHALTFAMYKRAAALCAPVPTDGSHKAVVLYGEGDKAFAAGTVMTQFRSFSIPQDALDDEAEIPRLLDASAK
ncbi:MAG: enoyl-CoA hydratase/isomerase family protein [Pseudomonadota bacterium]